MSAAASSPDNLDGSDEIDESFVPRFRELVTTVPVADEAVLYEEDTGVLHRLDPVAAAVCSLFDGTTSIRVTVDDLVEASGAPREVVGADVLALVRELGRKGLLAGVQFGTRTDLNSEHAD